MARVEVIREVPRPPAILEVVLKLNADEAHELRVLLGEQLAGRCETIFSALVDRGV
jgi:hypothetical protein